jgi:hypothetical protein
VDKGTRGQGVSRRRLRITEYRLRSSRGDTLTRGCATAFSRPPTFRFPFSPLFHPVSGRVGTAYQPSCLSRAPPAGRGKASPCTPRRGGRGKATPLPKTMPAQRSRSDRPLFNQSTNQPSNNPSILFPRPFPDSPLDSAPDSFPTLSPTLPRLFPDSSLDSFLDSVLYSSLSLRVQTAPP